jgi:hypothetical protein
MNQALKDFHQKFLGNKAIESVGEAFNEAGPIGEFIHWAADSAGDAITKLLQGVATLWGEQPDNFATHKEKEWDGLSDADKAGLTDVGPSPSHVTPSQGTDINFDL